jgi:hypothetical protein
LVFKDRFSNVANVSSASLAQQGFPLVVAVINPPVSNLESFIFTSSESDVSFGYRRIVIGTYFGGEMVFCRFVPNGGTINLQWIESRGGIARE